MATRINMMKLLLEVRGFAQLADLRLPTKPQGPLLLQFHSATAKVAALKRKRTLRVSIQDPPDIPQPIPIKYLDAGDGANF